MSNEEPIGEEDEQRVAAAVALAYSPMDESMPSTVRRRIEADAKAHFEGQARAHARTRAASGNAPSIPQSSASTTSAGSHVVEVEPQGGLLGSRGHGTRWGSRWGWGGALAAAACLALWVRPFVGSGGNVETARLAGSEARVEVRRAEGRVRVSGVPAAQAGAALQVWIRLDRDEALRPAALLGAGQLEGPLGRDVAGDLKCSMLQLGCAGIGEVVITREEPRGALLFDVSRSLRGGSTGQ